MIDQHVLPIVPGVSWIGILDPDLVTFDVVMETKYGTTYNSYFINAEKKAVIDTCKETFWPVYEAKLRAICDPAEIEYIIVNHTEPDHSGSVRFLLEIAPKAVVVGTGNAIRYLKDLIGHDFAHIAVKEGHTLDLGNKTLQFINAPNLHWPDTMYTWLVEDRLLFTCDSFGCHYSHPGVFDDKVDYFDDAFKYYYDVILRPYSKFMLKAIHKIRPLDIAMICPGHGPVLRSYWKKYLDLTEEFALDALKSPDKKKVLIAFVSAYHNTYRLAEYIAEGVRSASPELEAEIFDLEGKDLGLVDHKLSDAGAFIIGSPIINQNILLQIYQLFAMVNPIRDKGKLAGAFGSYGWSGDVMKILEHNIQSLKLNYFGESVFVKFSPHEDERRRCIEYGHAFGLKMLDPGGCEAE
jgi:flavorubredoxin